MSVARMGALCAALVVLVPTTALANEPASPTEPELLAQWHVTGDSGSNFTVAATITNQTGVAQPALDVTFPFRHPVSQVTGGLSVQDDSSLTLSPPTGLSAGASHLITLEVVSTGPVSRVPSTCQSTAPCRVVIAGEEDPQRLPATTAPAAPAIPAPSPTDTADPANPSIATATATPTPAPTPTVSDARPQAEPEPSLTQTPTQSGLASEPIPPTPRLAADREGLSLEYEVTSDWGSGQSVSVTVRNSGTQPIRNWAVELPADVAVQRMWNAESTSGGGVIRASNAAWNGKLAPDQAVEFGFTGSHGLGTTELLSCDATTDDTTTNCMVQP
ncbi:MAG: cellulose-binding domain-containing protein [Actinomycetia bacterium]|nr:cellulose-binding domain-containing protein [Actinomycetes bacterium]